MPDKLTIHDLERLRTWAEDAAASQGSLADAGALVVRLIAEALESRQPSKPPARRIVGWAAITKEARVHTIGAQEAAETAANASSAAEREAAARRVAELDAQVAESRRVGKALVDALQSASASAGWSMDRKRIEAALAEARKLGWLA